MERFFRRTCGLGAIALMLLSPLIMEESVMALTLKSSAFLPNGMIPRKHTCDGANLSPPLMWKDPPAGAKALALIVDDPDAPAGTWVHWVLYNLSVDKKTFPEGASSPREVLPDGSRQGKNDFGMIGYGGPCPPKGRAHRYFFKLYVLDAPVNLQPGATKGALLKAMKGHILGEAQLIGRYGR